MSTAKTSTAESGGLRVVLDSNVYISAFTHPKGLPFRIWRQAFTRSYTLLLSPAIVNEVARSLRLKFGWDDGRIISRLKVLAKVADIIEPTQTVVIFQGSQEPDNRILECAVAGKADLIVSGDRDLQRLKMYNNIAIARPVDFYRTLGSPV